MVQWLRRYGAGGLGSSPGLRTRSHVPKLKISNATAKAQCSQIYTCTYIYIYIYIYILFQFLWYYQLEADTSEYKPSKSAFRVVVGFSRTVYFMIVDRRGRWRKQKAHAGKGLN